MYNVPLHGVPYLCHRKMAGDKAADATEIRNTPPAGNEYSRLREKQPTDTDN
ncbi:hypothetical protein [uncultured Alistipes sp.]|uniref:hypothetical protein n=1 Tax=uncultured Alistipes sp. TaxID=538949 RepID=UPI002637B282|nr:hypothetical protein [uncultured Alistipes sp.]